jgi:hypothetical protein
MLGRVGTGLPELYFLESMSSTPHNVERWIELMIVAQKHPEDQACKASGQYYGHNFPIPTDQSDECKEADEDGKQINRSRTRKDHVQAEPDGQI